MRLADKFSELIIGKKEHRLEDKLTLYVLFFGGVITLIGSILNIVERLNPFVITVPLGYCVIVAYFFYLARVKGYIKPLILPLVIITFLDIVAMWFFNAGFDGPMSILFLVAIFFGLLIIKAENRKWIYLTYLILQVAIFCLHYVFPDLIINYSSPAERFVDVLLTIIYASFFIYLGLNVILREYGNERKMAYKRGNELEEANKNLLEATKTKDKFFSILAQDLKSPLTSFKHITEILADSYKEMSEKEKLLYLNTMKESSANLLLLLDNLLDWSMSQRGMIPYNPVLVDLRYVMELALNQLSEKARQKGVPIINGIKSKTPLIADQAMMVAIFRNLISNAIKFTSAPGIIEVSSLNEKEYITITIKDQGIGMDENQLSRLFKIGESTARKGTENETGSGLGLLLCKDFADRHNGVISAESTPGKGSAFTVTLPKLK